MAPTRQQIEAALAKLPEEQHAEFLAEVRRRMEAEPSSSKPARPTSPYAPAGSTTVLPFSSAIGVPIPIQAQNPEEAAEIESGVQLGSGLAAMAGPALLSVPRTIPQVLMMGGTYAGAQFLEKKLGLPRWMAEAATLITPRKKLAQWILGGGTKKAKKEVRDLVAERLEREVKRRAETEARRGMSTSGRGSVVPVSTKSTPISSEPTPTLAGPDVAEIVPRELSEPLVKKTVKEFVTKSPDFRRAGGSKMKRAWREHHGRAEQGSVTADDIAAMRARGATQEQVNAALLRSSQAPKTEWGVIQGSVKPPGSTNIIEKVLTWRKTHKLSDAQIVNALREQFGIKGKEARQLVELLPK